MVGTLLSMIFGPRGPWGEGRLRRRYVEPFLGGAAVALEMPHDVDVVASDDDAHARGASVITTNSVAAASLYAGRAWQMTDVDEKRRISAKAGDRPDAACLLMWRYA